MNETMQNDDDVFEAGEDCNACDDDDLSERLYAIKPPGKGDSGMAEER